MIRKLASGEFRHYSRKKDPRLFRRLRSEKVALRADWSTRNLRKSAVSYQPSAIS